MTDGQMDGRTEAIAISPTLFLKSVGIKIQVHKDYILFLR